MQNLQSMQPSNLQVLRLAIAKFSHATTTIDHVGPLTWNHVTDNGDLICIFEKIQNSASMPTSLIQRVVRGNVILEDIDLTNLVRMAALRAESDLNGSLPKFPFAAVIKLPCLAIKYPDGGGHIRRFQIKFRTEGDYSTALALLSSIGCPLTQGNTSAPRPTPSVSSWTSGHLSHAPSMMNPSMLTGSIGAPFNHIGPYGSQKTTPLRASSPASTVSYAPCRLGPRQPTFNRPTQNIEPVAMAPFQNTHASQTPDQELEPSSSQLSTVSAVHSIDQLNQMLPPKRDLPFQKPPRKTPRTACLNRTAPDPFSSSQSRNPATAQERFRHPLHAVMQSEPADPNSSLLESQPQLLSPQSLYPEASQSLLAYKSLTASQEVPIINSIIERSTQKPKAPKTPHSQGQSDTNNRINSVDGEDGTQDQLLPLPLPPHPPAPAREPDPHTTSMTEDHLAQYLAAPTPERIAFLENWICELIEDDRFMNLCQDVEGTWRRFAFGKKQ